MDDLIKFKRLIIFLTQNKEKWVTKSDIIFNVTLNPDEFRQCILVATELGLIETQTMQIHTKPVLHYSLRSDLNNSYKTRFKEEKKVEQRKEKRKPDAFSESSSGT